MTVAFYMDHHVPRAITVGVRLQGVDVLTAYEDGTDRLNDRALLDRAAELGRVLFTFDNDLVIKAHRRQRDGIAFYGIIYAHPLSVSIGTCIQELVLIAEAGTPADLMNQLYFLPL